MSQHTKNLVKALANNDKEEAKNYFLASISEKVKKAIDNRRLEVSAKFQSSK